MGLLDEVLKADAELVFTNLDEFGECVVFTPKDRDSRRINAAIDRNAPLVDAAGFPIVGITILVRNHGLYGITPDEAMAIGVVQLKRHKGATSTETFSKLSIVREDAGMLLLKVE